MTDIDTSQALARRVLASRRGLVCGAAGLGAAGVLAACGTADSPSPSGEGDGGGGDRDGATGEADGGGALIPTADVPVGGGVVVGETVVVQPSADEFAAFSALCPHQGTLVEAPDDDGVIVCPNHQSQFGMDGGLLQGPAETGLEEVDITVEDGNVYAA